MKQHEQLNHRYLTLMERTAVHQPLLLTYGSVGVYVGNILHLSAQQHCALPRTSYELGVGLGNELTSPQIITVYHAFIHSFGYSFFFCVTNHTSRGVKHLHLISPA